MGKQDFKWVYKSRLAYFKEERLLNLQLRITTFRCTIYTETTTDSSEGREHILLH